MEGARTGHLKIRRAVQWALLALAGTHGVVAHGLSLGAAELYSPLGRPLDVRISVQGGEQMEARCFQLQAVDQGEDVSWVSGARVRIEQRRSGVSLRVQTSRPMHEPIASFSVRYRCGQDDVVRHYRMLIDPQDFRVPSASLPASVGLKASPEAPASVRREVAARPALELGQAYRVDGRESFRDLARRTMPGNRSAQRKIEAILRSRYPIYPEGVAPAGAYIELPLADEVSAPPVTGAQRSVLTPSPSPVPPAAKPPQPLPRPSAPPLLATPTPTPTAPPAPTATPALTQPAATAGVAEADAQFRLRITADTLDMQPKVVLTEQDKLLLREKQALLDADHQAAQMLALRHQISQLERRVIALQDTMKKQEELSKKRADLTRLEVGAAGAADEKDAVPWWVWVVVPLAAGAGGGLLTLAMLAWLRQEDDDRFEDSRLDVPGERSPFNSVDRSTWAHPGEDNKPSAEPEIVDSASHVENITQRVEGLLAVHQTDDAIRLLMEEIQRNPFRFNFWMILFEIYRVRDMKAEFESLARECEASYGKLRLWYKVMAMGRSFDPENPLYRVDEDTPHQFDVGAPLPGVYAVPPVDWSDYIEVDDVPGMEVKYLASGYDEADLTPPDEATEGDRASEAALGDTEPPAVGLALLDKPAQPGSAQSADSMDWKVPEMTPAPMPTQRPDAVGGMDIPRDSRDRALARRSADHTLASEFAASLLMSSTPALAPATAERSPSEPISGRDLPEMPPQALMESLELPPIQFEADTAAVESVVSDPANSRLPEVDQDLRSMVRRALEAPDASATSSQSTFVPSVTIDVEDPELGNESSLKLELAQTLIEQGDFRLAADILEELLDHGSDQELEAANRLLAELTQRRSAKPST